MEAYSILYTQYGQRVNELAKKQPGNLLYQALVKSHDELYNPQAAWYSFHMPGSRFSNYTNDIKTSLESDRFQKMDTEIVSTTGESEEANPQQNAEDQERGSGEERIGGSVHHRIATFAIGHAIKKYMEAILGESPYEDAQKASEWTVDEIPYQLLKKLGIRKAKEITGIGGGIHDPLFSYKPHFFDNQGGDELDHHMAKHSHNKLSHLTHLDDDALWYDHIKHHDNMNARHHLNLLHLGGVTKHAHHLYTHHKPHEYILNDLHRIKHLDEPRFPHKLPVKGCGVCGGTKELYVHNKNISDITCKPCMDSMGMTHKRNRVDITQPLESSNVPEHKELHEKIKHNNLIAQIGGTEHSNLWQQFENTFTGSKAFIKLWKKSYVMNRAYQPADLNKLAFAIGFYLYNEIEVNDHFLDNLNASAIRYLEATQKEDVKKLPLTHKFMTFDEIKEAVQKRPGILKTLIFDIDNE